MFLKVPHVCDQTIFSNSKCIEMQLISRFMYLYYNETAVVKYLQASVIINAPLPTESNKILALSESISIPVSRTCSNLKVIPLNDRPKYVIGIDTGE